MAVRFEIEAIFPITGHGYLIMAKCLEEGKNFFLPENSRLGAAPITKRMQVPRLLDQAGQQRLDVFVFQLKHEKDRDKLPIGEVVELLPADELEFLFPWEKIQGSENALEQELAKEVTNDHPLSGKPVKAIARRVDQDDVLFQFETDRYAVVHLTCKGKRERSPDFPFTRMFEHWTDVYEQVILEDQAS